MSVCFRGNREAQGPKGQNFCHEIMRHLLMLKVRFASAKDWKSEIASWTKQMDIDIAMKFLVGTKTSA